MDGRRCLIDNDISAYSGKRRPEYERLLDDISCGRVGGLLTWHLDRLNRSPVELERLIKVLERNDVIVQTVTAGVIDLSSASGRAVARTLSAWARFESEHKSERMRAATMQRALAGAPAGGSFRPFGYGHDKLTLVPAEAKIVREMVRRLLSGTSLQDLAVDLAARGVTTTRGNPWTRQHLAAFLVSPRIAGWRGEPGAPRSRFGSPFLARAQWPAIVSRRDVERVRTLLADDTERPGGRRRWLLAGILLCSLCGRPLSAVKTTNPNKAITYMCVRPSTDPGQGCGRTSINLIRSDAHITESIIDAVAGGIVARILALPGDIYAAERTALAGHEVRLRSLGRDLDDGIIPRQEWMRRRDRIQRRIDNTLDSLNDSPTREALAAIPVARADFAAAWNAAPMRQRRALIRALTTELAVDRFIHHRVTQPSQRIRISWRG